MISRYGHRCFTCHKWTFFQHASKIMDARRKNLNCTKATWNAFHTCGSLAVSRSQWDFLTKKKHSVEFHIHFKDIGHMASSTKNCDDDETSSFCAAFGSSVFFLTSTLKHHQPCTLLQSASQLQLSFGAFRKTKPQKLLDPTNLYESIFCSVFFFESTPSA